MKFPDHLQVPESIAPLPPSLLLTFRTRRTIHTTATVGRNVFARCTSGTVVVVGGGQLVVRKAVNVSQRQSTSKSKLVKIKVSQSHQYSLSNEPYLTASTRFALGVRIVDRMVSARSVFFGTRAIQARRRRGGRLMGPRTAGSTNIR